MYACVGVPVIMHVRVNVCTRMCALRGGVHASRYVRVRVRDPSAGLCCLWSAPVGADSLFCLHFYIFRKGLFI